MKLAVMLTTRFGGGAALLAVSLMLAPGCVKMKIMETREEVRRPVAEPRMIQEVSYPLEKDPTRRYRVGPKDVLFIDERQDPELTKNYVVTAEGNILLPYLGALKVSELTAEQIQEAVNGALTEYIRSPDAKVGIAEYNSKVVYVLGQVNKPGPIVMNADALTVQEAVIAAGFPTPDASLKRTRVITPAMYNPIVLQVNLDEILYRGVMEENVMLEPGDYVFVPSRYNVNLAGAIEELLRPIQGISDLYYRSQFYESGGGYGGGNSYSGRR